MPVSFVMSTTECHIVLLCIETLTSLSKADAAISDTTKKLHITFSSLDHEYTFLIRWASWLSPSPSQRIGPHQFLAYNATRTPVTGSRTARNVPYLSSFLMDVLLLSQWPAVIIVQNTFLFVLLVQPTWPLPPHQPSALNTFLSLIILSILICYLPHLHIYKLCHTHYICVLYAEVAPSVSDEG